MSNTIARKKIRTEVSKRASVFSLPYLVARDKGYFAEEGIDIEFVESAYREPGAIAQPIEDHRLVSSFGGPSRFEAGESNLYRACEWGQVRRTYDGKRGGQVVAKRAAVVSQAIIVRSDSPYNIPQDLANVPVGVNFHHGSHYIAIQLLEGFLPKKEIKIVHVGGGNGRFSAVRDGIVEAAAVMEPWITVAEKLGYKIIAEAHYVGLEIASPDVDEETFETVNRVIRRAVKDLQTDPLLYAHYLIEGVPEDIVHLEPSDFSANRLRYANPAPYSEADFRRTYNWMVEWDLIQPDATFNQIVDNRIEAIA